MKKVLVIDSQGGGHWGLWKTENRSKDYPKPKNRDRSITTENRIQNHHNRRFIQLNFQNGPVTGIISPDRQNFFSFAQDRKRLETKNIGWDKRFPVCVGNQLIVSYNITGKLFVSRFANFEGILGFSVQSIILADLSGNRCSFQRVQKVMVCNLGLVDFDPFLFQESLPVRVLFRELSTCLLRFWSFLRNAVLSTLPDNPRDSRFRTVSHGLQIRVWYLPDNCQSCYFL